MNRMKYRGYFGEIKSIDEKANLMHGEVIGPCKDVITFQGRTVEELKKAFRDSIDDYLEWCLERGEQPEKAFSGNLRLRIPPSLHAQLSLEAARQSVSLNEFINEKLRNIE